MSFLPAGVIFVQASSDAFEASKYVDSQHGLRLRADSTHLKPLQDAFENESLDIHLFVLQATGKLKAVYGLSITKTGLRVIGMEMKFQVTIMRNIS